MKEVESYDIIYLLTGGIMGKQFEISQNKEDMIEFVSFLFQNNFRLSFGVATETNENLVSNYISSPSKDYNWKYFEIKNLKEFKKKDEKINLFNTTLSIFKGEMKKLEAYDANLADCRDCCFYPMIEYSPNYRLWISSDAKGKEIWNDFDFIKKWFAKNYIAVSQNKSKKFIGKQKFQEAKQNF